MRQTPTMRMVDEHGLSAALAPMTAGRPRVVVAGNFATPHTVLRWIDGVLPTYQLFALNAQAGMPDRPGVVHETPFVGPGVRRSPRLHLRLGRYGVSPGPSGYLASEHVT